jgi:hypothetical protein
MFFAFVISVTGMAKYIWRRIPPMKRDEVLDLAKVTLVDRGADYGDARVNFDYGSEGDEGAGSPMYDLSKAVTFS